MQPSGTPESMVRLSDILSSARKKGVRLWSENGRLHYSVPKGALTGEEFDNLRAFSGRIVEILAHAVNTETAEPSRPRPRQDAPSHQAPLAFSQLWRWRLFHLDRRRSSRTIASAVRLAGALDIEAFGRSIEGLICRHDALRTRIVIVEGVPIQFVGETERRPIEIEDLSGLSEQSAIRAIERIFDQCVLERTNLAVDSPFSVNLLQIGMNDNVAIIAMDHMISDALSMHVLIDELFAMYSQAAKGEEPCLPSVPVQFCDYAEWQSDNSKPWVEAHGAYWHDRLIDCERFRFPAERTASNGAPEVWAAAPIKIGRDLKHKLLRLSRLTRITLPVCFLTAYVALVSRWCNGADVVIQVQTSGRDSVRVARAIGYFASLICIRLRKCDWTFDELAKQVGREYSEAVAHCDVTYMATQFSTTEISRNTIFNWVPGHDGFSSDESTLSSDGIIVTPIPLTNPALRDMSWENDPEIVLYDTDEGVVGGVHFPRFLFSDETMTKFAGNFVRVLNTMVALPSARIRDIQLL